MAESQIPEDLRQFILVNCPSVPHLEALLLLRRDSLRSWDGAGMAQRLYIDGKNAADVLADLAAAGLAATDDAVVFRYAPASAGVAQLVDQLAELHAHALLAVTNLIHGRSAQLFADAFKLRKD